MKYVSTRGSAPVLGFSDVVLAGLATDGGLYVPEAWPQIGQKSLHFSPANDGNLSYADLAADVMTPFVSPDFDEVTLQSITREAYATFRHQDVVPLVPLGDNQFLMELFHGPTLAFKDVALQLLGRFFDHILSLRGERVMIVGATSGDTGSAAIDGLSGCTNVDVVILYPYGRVSDVQRKQMTTVTSPNVHAVAIDGTFDDCQDLVKAMFNDITFRNETRLSAINSINWARVMAQVVYYVEAARRFAGPIDVTVPTGNFGNVLSGWIAKMMGANIRHLIVASNSNDILTRFFETRHMTVSGVHPTLSPSMDIQVSSNFERLLFEMNGRNGARTAEQLVQFRTSGDLVVADSQFDEWISPTFRAGRCSDAQTLDTIAQFFGQHERAIDPHTAVGLFVSRQHVTVDVPMVTLATAHPAKFPDAVEKATGVRPSLPAHLADLFDRPERTQTLANDISVVQDFVTSVSRNA